MPVDPSAQVAASARVHPDAQIGPQAVIGEFAIVEEDTVIGAGCRLEPYVYVKRWTTLTWFREPLDFITMTCLLVALSLPGLFGCT